jgi:hypothetical protein
LWHNRENVIAHRGIAVCAGTIGAHNLRLFVDAARLGVDLDDMRSVHKLPLF